MDLKEGDSGWLGAWWLGFVLCGLGALLLALPIAMLPTALAGVDEPPADQVCRSRLASRTSSFRNDPLTGSTQAS